MEHAVKFYRVYGVESLERWLTVCLPIATLHSLANLLGQFSCFDLVKLQACTVCNVQCTAALAMATFEQCKTISAAIIGRAIILPSIFPFD